MSERAANHPEACERCDRGNATWHAPSPLWNAVMRDPTTGHDRYSIVCPLCFADLAAEMGFDYSWHFGPHEDVSGLWADADGRVWDAAVCLWVLA